MMDRETVDVAFRISTLLLGGLGAWKLIVELLRTRRTHLRDDYRFAREFFKDLNAAPNMHPFLKQKGYQALVGESDLSPDEVEYLLALHDPVRVLRSYVLGRKYLEFRATSASTKLELKLKYQHKWSRQWRKLAYFISYFVCYTLAVAPLMLPGFKLLSPTEGLVLFIFTAPAFLPAGFAMITAGVRINRAEELVASQNPSAKKAIHIVEQSA